MKGILAAGA